MVFKKFKEDIVEPYPKSKIVITFYSRYKMTTLLMTGGNWRPCIMTIKGSTERLRAEQNGPTLGFTKCGK